MEEIQPFPPSLWEFYITHHWFLHKDKDGHKEAGGTGVSARDEPPRVVCFFFADSSKASRSRAHCCAREKPPQTEYKTESSLEREREGERGKKIIFF